MSKDGTLIFKDGKWVEGAVEAAERLACFHDIKYYYPLLIDYLRIALGILAGFTIGMNQPLLTAALLLGSTLLDWIDGPVARACNQCTLFGSGVDWFADIQAQVVTMAWWVSMNPKVLPWLLIATSIELATCVFDFATTATGRYPKLGRSQRGFSAILRWCMPGGTYSLFGTFLWLAYPLFALACCLDLSWPARSDLTDWLLRGSECLLIVPAILYVWCELAFLVFIVQQWTEASRSSKEVKATKVHNDGDAGAEFLGTLGEREQDSLNAVSKSMLALMKVEWEARKAAREIFWVNLWQRSGNDAPLQIDRLEEMDRWARTFVARHYDEGEGIELDGFGFIINPTGSKTQSWHIDYTTGYSTIFIPLSRLTPNNTMQYLVLPPSVPAEVYQRVITDPDKINLDEVIAHMEYVSIRQLLAKPFSAIKLGFGTIHRGISNIEQFDRCMYYISVKKRGALLPPEPLLAVFHDP